MMLAFCQNPLTIYEPTKEMLLPFGMVFGASILSWVGPDASCSAVSLRADISWPHGLFLIAKTLRSYD